MMVVSGDSGDCACDDSGHSLRLAIQFAILRETCPSHRRKTGQWRNPQCSLDNRAKPDSQRSPEQQREMY
jgi:hypothetical protein